ncbi:fumarylacetoacetate hydrolase family protein [Roseateles violae]|uniref:Fumarylacetoacetate hydrolase family protein n=1 Tax=Roseateles violae TaxID=3058042 RepID=A0ABT8DT45_9BURK|nr:fumarylacetoacetate hydrolase family protein [Pelomonas sp. PFR6]MDN3921278.1 fumarylacetoacetate hydrolase family protein [Pelomonas sp. PFR6]
MRIACFQSMGQRRVGLVSADGLQIAPLALPAEDARGGALALIERLSAGEPLPAAEPAQPLAGLRLEAPLPRPRRNVFCVGRNYQAHAQELSGSIFKNAPPAGMDWPIVFSKVPETVVADGAEVALPTEVSTQIDYEAELAVVIGRGGKNIAREQAMGHVFGYTIVNDVTARDVQTRHQQWHLGKSFDGFCPMGPWIVTADELDGRDTRLRCWVNEELRQDARTTDLIFDIPALIATISRGITLYPGDVIATGTPAGVGMGLVPPQYLKPDDVVRIEIDGIGTLSNRFV